MISNSNYIVLFNYVCKCTLFLTMISAAIRAYIKLSMKHCESKATMFGKVVIITGGTDGIGYETAKELAQRGARVIITGRFENKGLNACKNIRSETGNSNVTYQKLDLSSLESVKDFARRITETEEWLHVLVNNAGTSGLNDSYTKDGIVEDMQVNYFGPFLLTLLLLPLLKKSKPSRIINLSSILHYLGSVNMSKINVKGAYNELRSYSNSKLCNVVFTVELARRLVGSGIVVNAVHPGIVATGITGNACALVKILFYGWSLLCGKNVNQAAQTLVHVAVSEECETISGQYFVNCSKGYKHWKALDRILAQKLWNYSEILVGCKFALIPF